MSTPRSYKLLLAAMVLAGPAAAQQCPDANAVRLRTGFRVDALGLSDRHGFRSLAGSESAGGELPQLPPGRQNLLSCPRDRHAVKPLPIRKLKQQLRLFLSDIKHLGEFRRSEAN